MWLALLTLGSPLYYHFRREAFLGTLKHGAHNVLCSLPRLYCTSGEVIHSFCYFLLCFLLLSLEGELRVGVVHLHTCYLCSPWHTGHSVNKYLSE